MLNVGICCKRDILVSSVVFHGENVVGNGYAHAVVEVVCAVFRAEKASLTAQKRLCNT